MNDETHIAAWLAAEDYDAAVEAILGLYGTRVFRMMVGVLRDESAAEDTFQAFSIVLWQSLPSFKGGQPDLHVDLHDRAADDRSAAAQIKVT